MGFSSSWWSPLQFLTLLLKWRKQQRRWGYLSSASILLDGWSHWDGSSHSYSAEYSRVSQAWGSFQKGWLGCGNPISTAMAISGSQNALWDGRFCLERWKVKVKGVIHHDKCPHKFSPWSLAFLVFQNPEITASFLSFITFHWYNR